MSTDTTILSDLIAILSPALPYLSGISEKAGDGLIHKIGADGWDRAKKVLALLRPKIDKDPEAQEAVQHLLNEPNSQGCKALLRMQLKKMLENDPQLAKEIALLIRSDSGTSKKIATTKVDTINTPGSNNTVQVGTGNISIGQGRDIKIETSATDGSGE